MLSLSESRKIFWLFVALHCVLWVMMPVLMRYALPHDTIEGVLWGQHLEWGYDKNPWMNAWLTRLGWVVGGTSGWGIYALSSFFVGISFWSVFQLAQKITSPLNALISVLLLEGCVNYTLVPQGFNDNVIELGLWPLMFLCFYQALTSQKNRYWILTGLTAGLGLMTKYFTAIPIFVMFWFMCFSPKARRGFKSIGFLYAIITVMLVILPHLIWLFQHDFLTIRYAFNRAAQAHPNFIQFGFSQIIDFLLPLLIFFVLIKFKFKKSYYPEVKWDFNRQFVMSMAFGPLLLTVVLAMIFRWYLYNEWGVPFVALWGLGLVLLFEHRINLTRKQLKYFIVFIYGLMFLWALGYAEGLMIDQKHKHSDNYPAQEIADYVTNTYHQVYHKKLLYVAGSRYVGGYLAFYSKDHPSVWVEWNPDFSPWIDREHLQEYGAVFIQDNYYGTTVFGERPDTNEGKAFPKAILKQYPNLIILPVKYFSWKRGNKTLDKIPVLIAFLPPKGH